jgi:hypothetical protein
MVGQKYCFRRAPWLFLTLSCCSRRCSFKREIEYRNWMACIEMLGSLQLDDPSGKSRPAAASSSSGSKGPGAAIAPRSTGAAPDLAADELYEWLDRLTQARCAAVQTLAAGNVMVKHYTALGFRRSHKRVVKVGGVDDCVYSISL